MMMLMAMLAAQAQPELDCANPVTQADMNQCSAIAFQTADRAMNVVWANARRHMQQMDRESVRYRDNRDGRPGYFSALLESQRAWLRYRDTQCVLAGYSARGGSMEPLLINSCMRHLTEERTGFLRDLINGDGW